MSDEVLRKIRQIVEAALRRPESERAAWVDEACGDDLELRLQAEVALARAEEGPGDVVGPTGEDFQSLLMAVSAGDPQAANRFWEIVWDDLRGFARQVLRGFEGGGVPQTTSLVVRAYMRLMRSPRFPAKNRRYFLGAARTAMTRIVIETVRVRKTHLHLDGLLGRLEGILPVPDLDIERLVELLGRLQQDHDRPADVIRLRVLNGLSVKETALALDVCDRTVENDTKFALAWLSDRMGG